MPDDFDLQLISEEGETKMTRGTDCLGRPSAVTINEARRSYNDATMASSRASAVSMRNSKALRGSERGSTNESKESEKKSNGLTSRIIYEEKSSFETSQSEKPNEDAEEEEEEKSPDWAQDLLLLTHEPLRKDLALLQSAVLRVDCKPAEWMVLSFFRFFDKFCELTKQQFSVEMRVHCDWLCAPSADIDKEAAAEAAGIISAHDHRVELLRYQAEVNQQFQAIATLEAALLSQAAGASITGKTQEVGSAATRSMSKMVSMSKNGSGGSMSMESGFSLSAGGLNTPVTLLREAIGTLVEDMNSHLAAQEEVLPEAIIYRFGDDDAAAPPNLVTRIIGAAEAAWTVPEAVRGEALVPLLTWVVYYLHEREPFRAVALVAHLPKPIRKRIRRHTGILSQDESHADRLRSIQAVIENIEPASKGARKPGLIERFRNHRIKRATKPMLAHSTSSPAVVERESGMPELSAGGGVGRSDSRGTSQVPPSASRTRTVSREGGRMTSSSENASDARKSVGRRIKNQQSGAVTARLAAANANRESQETAMGGQNLAQAGLAPTDAGSEWWKNIDARHADKAMKTDMMTKAAPNIKF